MSVHVGVRQVVTVTGVDAASYLQGQISQDVDALAVGASAWSLILQPQGKVEAMFRITRTGDDTFLLDVEAGWGEVLRDRLQRFRMRVKVELSLETWTHHAYRGETVSAADPAAAGAPIVAPVDWIQPGTDVLALSLPEPAAQIIDDSEFEWLRIEAGVAAMGAELDENTIPAAAGVVDRTVSFTKGCYTGQELVARVDSRGNNTPKSLHRARGNGQPPAIGESLTVDGAEAALVTSVASTNDGWIGLVYLKRAFEAPIVAKSSSGEATVETLG